jgi:hypothetical protein
MRRVRNSEEEPDMSTTVPAALVSDELQRDPSSAMSSPTMSSRMAFAITVAIWGAVVLALAWVLPPAASYRVASSPSQWIIGL